MRIKVINRGGVVFDGDSKEFLEINEADECVADMLVEAEEQGYATQTFFSGRWEVIKC